MIFIAGAGVMSHAEQPGRQPSAGGICHAAHAPALLDLQVGSAAEGESGDPVFTWFWQPLCRVVTTYASNVWWPLHLGVLKVPGSLLFFIGFFMHIFHVLGLAGTASH